MEVIVKNKKVLFFLLFIFQICFINGMKKGSSEEGSSVEHISQKQDSSGRTINKRLEVKKDGHGSYKQQITNPQKGTSSQIKVAFEVSDGSDNVKITNVETKSSPVDGGIIQDNIIVLNNQEETNLKATLAGGENLNVPTTVDEKNGSTTEIFGSEQEIELEKEKDIIIFDQNDPELIKLGINFGNKPLYNDSDFNPSDINYKNFKKPPSSKKNGKGSFGIRFGERSSHPRPTGESTKFNDLTDAINATGKFFNKVTKKAKRALQYGIDWVSGKDKEVKEQKAKQEQLAKKKAEQERLAREKQQYEQEMAKQKADQEQLAREKSEQERLARKKQQYEQEMAKQKTEQEQLAKEEQQKRVQQLRQNPFEKVSPKQKKRFAGEQQVFEMFGRLKDTNTQNPNPNLRGRNRERGLGPRPGRGRNRGRGRGRPVSHPNGVRPVIGRGKRPSEKPIEEPPTKKPEPPTKKPELPQTPEEPGEKDDDNSDENNSDEMEIVEDVNSGDGLEKDYDDNSGVENNGSTGGSEEIQEESFWGK